MFLSLAPCHENFGTGQVQREGNMLAGTMGHPTLLGANALELCDVGGVIVGGERISEVLGFQKC